MRTSQPTSSLAPDTEQAKTLLDQMIAARALNRKAQKLAAYADEQAARANHAVMAYLGSVVADIEHVATRKPGLAEEFALALKVIEQRREAISAGMARAKATAKTETAPTPPSPGTPPNS